MLSLKARIRKKIKEQDMSVNAFEKKAGLKQSAVQNILQGRSKSPRIEVIRTIAHGLNCTVEELIGNDEPTSAGQIFFEIPALEDKVADTLDDSRWDANLYLNTMRLVVDTLTPYKQSIRKADTLYILNEVYAYSRKKNNSIPDKEFAEWFASKIMQRR